MENNELMVECPACGCGSQMGSLFCRGCGKKLPSQSFTADRVDAMQGRMAVRRLLSRAALWGGLVLLVALVVPALTPRRQMFDSGESADARRFRERMSVFSDALANQRAYDFSLEQPFSRDEVNAYMQWVMAREHPDARCSLDFSPDGLRVRWIRPWWVLHMWGFEWAPLMSFEALFVPGPEGLVAAAAWLNRLPLPGASGRPVEMFFRQRLEQTREWAVLRHLRCVEVGERMITLALTGSGDQ